jgi:cation:H+ antiporter
MIYLFFIAGLLLLISGAQILIKGSVAIAERLAIPPLIIGLTLVAFGTSSPELAVSVQAAFNNQADVALGNVIGSNIFNVLFILGLCACLLPLSVSKQLIKQDIPILLLITILVFVLALDGGISRLNALILVFALCLYLCFLIWQGKSQSSEHKNSRGVTDSSSPANAPEQSNAVLSKLFIDVLYIIAGLAALIFGSNFLVDASIEFAKMLGVSELVIGLTIVAIGTSLPEVVTSIIAVFQKQRDIAVGNVIGSNIFNLLAVLGVTGVISSSGIAVDSSLLGFEFPLLVAVALICLPMVFTGFEINRKEGLLLLAIYTFYSVYLYFRATAHPSLDLFHNVFFYIALPLIILPMLIVSFRQWQQQNMNKNDG